MNIILSGKQMNLSARQKNVIESKLSRLEKYFNNEVIVRATASTRKDDHIMEVTIPVNKSVIRAEATDPDLYSAVDSVISKLSRQLRKYKTKLNSRGNETIRFENVEDIEESLINSTEEPKITKKKKFEFHPMSQEEAALQLEMLDHDFYVFLNESTQAVNVIYKRKDGDYGVIEPK